MLSSAYTKVSVHVVHNIWLTETWQTRATSYLGVRAVFEGR